MLLWECLLMRESCVLQVQLNGPFSSTSISTTASIQVLSPKRVQVLSPTGQPPFPVAHSAQCCACCVAFPSAACQNFNIAAVSEAKHVVAAQRVTFWETG